MKRLRNVGLWSLGLLGFALVLLQNAYAIDSVSAMRAANLWTRISYSGDAHEESQPPHHVQLADLDEDGRDEVIYLRRVTCYTPGLDCTNQVTVLASPIQPRSRLLNESARSLSLDEDEKQSAIKLGYDQDAALQIPGDVEQLVIVGRTVRVTFLATLASDACHRSSRKLDGVASKEDLCPVPGRYVWTLRWTPGKLQRLESSRLL